MWPGTWDLSIDITQSFHCHWNWVKDSVSKITRRFDNSFVILTTSISANLLRHRLTSSIIEYFLVNEQNFGILYYPNVISLRLSLEKSPLWGDKTRGAMNKRYVGLWGSRRRARRVIDERNPCITHSLTHWLRTCYRSNLTEKRGERSRINLTADYPLPSGGPRATAVCGVPTDVSPALCNEPQDDRREQRINEGSQGKRLTTGVHVWDLEETDQEENIHQRTKSRELITRRRYRRKWSRGRTRRKRKTYQGSLLNDSINNKQMNIMKTMIKRKDDE